MNMKVEIFNSSDDRWLKILQILPEDLKDIYFTPDYLQLYESQNSLAQCFCCREGDHILIYPFLLNKIANTCFYDIESAYGYGGPITNTLDRSFINNAENLFIDYCRETNIVAEFIRFHPILLNQDIFKREIDVSFNRNTIYVDLNVSDINIWEQQISSKNRNVIRKAFKEGVQIKLDADKTFEKDFMQLYRKTMQRTKADHFYYFDDNYFNKLFAMQNCLLILAHYKEQIIAAASFLISGIYAHYHLSATAWEYRSLAATNLLLFEAIKMFSSMGIKYLHLGGGRTDSQTDTLYKFKASFSKLNADFYVGKRVHNKEIYEALCQKWDESHTTKSTIFLRYKVI